MPDTTFWQQRFQTLGIHSVGPGDTATEEELEQHRLVFLREVQPFLARLKGPVLDFGCGVGRWVMDLPRPYLGLDLTPQHIEVCRAKFQQEKDVEFMLSENLKTLPDKSFNSIFTVTVLQHIVEPDIRKAVLRQFKRVLRDDGVLLSVEWAEGQREFEWCRAVCKRELARLFSVMCVGQLVEQGRRHSIMISRCKNRSLVSL